MRRSTLACMVLVGALAVASRALADASPGDTAASDVLFKEAKSLIKEGRYSEACPKFEESQRLDPTAGTLLNLGECYQHLSPPRLASAWGAFRQSQALARQRGDTARQAAATQRADALE